MGSKEEKIDKQIILEHCGNCVKLDDENWKCFAFTKFFFLWGEGKCWAYERNLIKWGDTLCKMIEYSIYKEGVSNLSLKMEEEKVRRKIEEAEGVSIKEIREAFREDTSGRNIKKAGSGEKADRTHKLFPRGRMKDNRLIIPWEDL